MITLQDHSGCNLSNDLLTMYEERSREDDERHLPPRNLLSRQGRVDGPGDSDGNRFADLNRDEDVDGLRRQSNGRADPEGTFPIGHRVGKIMLNLGLWMGQMAHGVEDYAASECESTRWASDSRRGNSDLDDRDQESTHLASGSR
jgi:hypothetical protein